jgi:hypothetical protein
MHGREIECIQDSDGKTRIDHYKDFGIGWRIILNWILEK